MPISSLRLLGTAFACSLPTFVSSWDYREHFAITYRGLQAACESRPTHDGRLCSEAGIMCFSHMVAMAGDYILEPEGFYKGEGNDRRFKWSRAGIHCGNLLFGESALAKDGVGKSGIAYCPVLVPENAKHSSDDNCKHEPAQALDRTVDAQCVAPPGLQWSKSIPTTLIKNPFNRLGRWLWFAMSNGRHFQTDSLDKWQDYAKASAHSENEQDRLSKLAFAIHFFEDSFAAGHIGLERSFKRTGWQPGARQDYAHAYHEDLNRSGQFLSIDTKSQINADHKWFGYGDRKLCAESLYAIGNADREPEEFSDDLVSFTASAQLAEFSKTSQDREFLSLVGAAIALRSNDPESVSEEQAVLSLAKRRHFFQSLMDLLQPCLNSDWCDKTELLVADKPPAPAGGSGFLEGPECTLDEHSDVNDALSLYRCRSTARPVTTASAAAIGRMIGPAGQGLKDLDKDIEVLRWSAPSKYRTNDPQSAEGGSLNEDHLLLHFKDYQSTCYMPERSSSAWKLSLNNVSSAEPNLRGKSLDIGLETEIFRRVNLEVTTSLVDEDREHVHGPFNSARATYAISPLPMTLRRYFNASIRVNVGYDGIWEGNRRRNWFVGTGIAGEVPVGRYVLEYSLTRNWHKNSFYDYEDATVASIALKIPSIKLYEPRSRSETQSTALDCN